MICAYLGIMMVYHTVNSLTKDEIIASYSIHSGVNMMYLFLIMYYKISPILVRFVINMLLAYYVFDIQQLFVLSFKTKDIITFLPHHIVSLSFILGYRYEVLPLSIGIPFLTLFEISNIFLQLFQLSSKKGWVVMRNLLTIPFVFTYVPIRGLFIPVCSLGFIPYIKNMSPYLMIWYGMHIVFLNIFSIYFSVVIANKFVNHINKRKIT